MEYNIHVIIFWILLADSIMANLIAQVAPKWYGKHFQILSRILPVTKGWALVYLLLVLWAGCILRAGGFIAI